MVAYKIITKNKKESEIILKLKPILKTITKETANALQIMIIGLVLSASTITMKYKPAYEVRVNNESLGFVESKEDFNNLIQEKIINKTEPNLESVTLAFEPQYEQKLILREKATNEQEILKKLQDTATTMYKFYAVTLNDKTKAYVDTLEEAEKVVEKIKKEHKSDDIKLNIALSEKYTENKEEVKTDTTKKAEKTMEEEIKELLEEKEAKKAIATIKGINVSVLPVSGRISSRFGARSSIRSGAHTGLDIACKRGTKIKVVAKGTVVFAERKGAYGNLIKVDHGNGVETWYAHCDEIIAKVGQKVKAGEVIGKVGSTGNSTGPHLHLEVRIKGNAVNPQKYLYK